MSESAWMSFEARAGEVKDAYTRKGATATMTGEIVLGRGKSENCRSPSGREELLFRARSNEWRRPSRVLIMTPGLVFAC